VPADAPALIFPALGSFYAVAGPLAEALLRVAVGLALVPHGLRMFFGLFPTTGLPVRSMAMLAYAYDELGYRPGKLWAPLTAIAELVGGPMLALGLLTRPVAVPIFVLLALAAWDHGRRQGYFWNQVGLEYPMVWSIAALYFVFNGGGAWSLDHMLLGFEF